MVTRVSGAMIDPDVVPGAASAQEYVAGSDDGKFITPDAAFSAAVPVELTDGATITPDLSAGLNFTVTLGGNRTLGDPANVKPGQCGVIEINQDATGSRTLSFGSAWKFAGGEAPELSTGANARDLLSYLVLPGGDVFVSLIRDVR